MGYTCACGYLGGSAALLTRQAVDLAEASEADYTVQRDELFASAERTLIDNFASGPSEVAGYKEAMDDVRTLDSEGFLRQGLLAFAAAPERKNAVLLLHIDVALRMAFLVLAMGLFIRMPGIRKIGLLLFMASIVVQVMANFQLSETLMAFGDAAIKPLEAAAEEHGLVGKYEPDFLRDKLVKTPWMVLGTLSLPFPIIGLIVFARSKSLAQALGEKPKSA